MKTVLHKADTRGYADHGWLKSHHSFSFANYNDPERNGFGLLRVLNDDMVDGGEGFGTHPHSNMEIVSIPLYGELKHKDSMGNITTIKKNEVQIMSAGSGITHSEYNNDPKESVKFLQIWVYPNVQNTTPGYDQKTFEPSERLNKFQTVVSPNGTGVKIKQDAWFSLTNLSSNTEVTYNLNKQNNGVYIFVLSGNIKVHNIELNQRDALGITDTQQINIKGNQDSEVLLIEVPMSQ
jgi:quercetin 2,3-dioxygenase